MTTENTPAAEQTFESQVKDAVSAMTQAADGSWALPEGLSEPLAFAANAERRRRDTQAAYSRTQVENKQLHAENTKLTENWQQDFTSKLTAEEQTELEELKATDPDAWRQKLNDYEQTRSSVFTQKTAEIKSEVELERRKQQLAEFNLANPDIQISDDDVPPRLMKQLETGELSFEAFLTSAKDFLTKGKVISTGEVPTIEPNLSETGGSSTPTNTAVEADMHESYKTEMY